MSMIKANETVTRGSGRTSFGKLALIACTVVSAACAQAPAVIGDTALQASDARTIVLISGPSSYPRGVHAYNAGIAFLAACLQQVPGVQAILHTNGWPTEPSALEVADAILMFMNGGGGHEILQQERLEQVRRLMDRGVGLGAIHYALDVPEGRGSDEFLDWLGGYYEAGYSVNPTWVARVEEVPEHPVTRGVTPFTLRDEWYFSIRFREGMEGVTPLLRAAPSDQTRGGPYANPPGPYPHIVEAAGQLETIAWVREREGGGRGFGYTGAHFHENWDHPDARTLVLNALLWIAGTEVPPEGAACDVRAEDFLDLHPNR
jgi:type 1 glutamine amidotransferase